MKKNSLSFMNTGLKLEGDSNDAREVLRAFKAQISAQTGKHITGIAPQILEEDADFLISSLPRQD